MPGLNNRAPWTPFDRVTPLVRAAIFFKMSCQTNESNQNPLLDVRTTLVAKFLSEMVSSVFRNLTNRKDAVLYSIMFYMSRR